jgi:structural maintenance of chromosomes protein 6
MTLNDDSFRHAGSIISLHLLNFMCHTNFLVEFRPRINFVVGSNGSGKSAVLTALTVGLGGKASFTSRGSNIESLIREGCDEASVTISIFNGGENSYCHEFYGDRISITRTIKRNSGSFYKITGMVSAKNVKRTKEEVSAICHVFNLQIDNPLVILTQEVAKRFLINSTPKDFYEVSQIVTKSFSFSAKPRRLNSSPSIMPTLRTRSTL